MSITKQRLTTAKLLPVVIAAGMLFGASNAMAAATATFDFAALADSASVGEGTWDSKASMGPISSAGVWTVSTIGVSASASAPGLTPDAYLDSNIAGLGVCSLSSCVGNGDDNTGIAGDPDPIPTDHSFETLILTFNTAVKLDSLLFRDRDHAVHTSDFSLEINDILWSPGLSLAGIAASTTYRFERIAGDKDVRDFYLASATVTAVPIPAAAWLFGSALIGLAGIARKRK